LGFELFQRLFLFINSNGFTCIEGKVLSNSSDLSIMHALLSSFQ